MIVIALLTLALGLMLPPQHLEIANRVAGDGKPECLSHWQDGTIGPCLPAFAIKAGGHVNGWSIGTRITFTRAATVRLTQDEFALLAGHEIAHYYLGHDTSNPADELAADRLGAQLACQAGYDPVKAVSLFRFISAGKNHPRRAERRAAVLGVGCGRRTSLL